MAFSLPFIDFPGIWERIQRNCWPVESIRDQVTGEQGIQLGHTGPLGARRPFHLRGRELFTHKHIIGKTGYGKSNLLANIYKHFIGQGVPVALIDPHSDLAEGLLGYLLAAGYFRTKQGKNEPRDDFLYIDFGIKNDRDDPLYLLPFNFLKQPYNKRRIAKNFADVCFRIWPYLQQTSPHFKNVLQNAIVVLIDNELPLIQLQTVIGEDKAYREYLLRHVDDPAVLWFFRHRFDKWDARFAPQMKESTLNKLSNLLFEDVLRYSLGQTENRLNFKDIINSGKTVIFNLGGLDKETKQFLGCLLTMGFETAMYARDGIVPWERKHYVFGLDEFQMFMSTSQDTFTTFLSEARKFKVWLIMAHQYLAQLPYELVAALQNTQRIVLRLEDDAGLMAERIGKYSPTLPKDEIADEAARQRTHGLYESVKEQYEEWANEIKSLYVGEGLIKLENRVEKFKALKFPEPRFVMKELQALKQLYAEQLMIHRDIAVPLVDRAYPTDTTPSQATSDIFANREVA